MTVNNDRLPIFRERYAIICGTPYTSSICCFVYCGGIYFPRLLWSTHGNTEIHCKPGPVQSTLGRRKPDIRSQQINAMSTILPVGCPLWRRKRCMRTTIASNEHAYGKIVGLQSMQGWHTMLALAVPTSVVVSGLWVAVLGAKTMYGPP